MTGAQFTGENGPLVWGFRVSLTAIGVLLTLFAGMSLSSMQGIVGSLDGMREEIVGIRAEIGTVRLDVAEVRERLAGNYITRAEATRMVEELERRVNERINREMFQGYSRPGQP